MSRRVRTIFLVVVMSALLVLYFGAIGLCMLNDKRRDRRDARKTAASERNADVATPSTDLEIL